VWCFLGQEPLRGGYRGFAGSIFTGASFAGLRLCTLAIKFYRTKVTDKIDENTDPPVDYDYEKAETKSPLLLFFLPWKFLPWAFFGGWVALGVVKLVCL